jgi:hypothetical protein
MPNPASTVDIESRWRPLTTAEGIVAGTRLDDAWRMLKRQVPGIEDRFVTEADLQDDAVQVLAEAVIRVLQSNTNGYRKGAISVDDATRSWELDESVRAGLYFPDEDIVRLTGGPTGVRRAFSVMPS